MTLARGDVKEVCGLLLGSGTKVEAIVPAANVASDPSRHFELDPAVLIGAHRSQRSGGPDIIGHYHSHPSGVAEPSPTDRACASPDGSFWLIAAGERARLWVAGRARDGQVQFVEGTIVVA